VSGAARILVVDDQEEVRELVRTLLERAGHRVAGAEDGRAALRALYEGPVDLVVLDVNMPGLDGWQTLERIRELTEVPVLMLTGRDAELERVRGLRAGADDYVTKPFGRQELLARIDALLRRASREREAPPTSYADDFVSIDFAQHVVRSGEEVLPLTPLEFRLLTAFVRRPNRVLSRDQLLELVWGHTRGVSPDEVKLYVGYLRRKLRSAGEEDSPIETVRGFGYRYRPTRAA
jgi:DNA-binding response OmpR family regulator